jgi:NADH:ubiquinone oxidoreductase subunit 5 (subunit L)/multisubunit Na+/H+ antiporter MnhA subunit
LLYILMHALSKAGLFLCAGIVEHNCGTKDMRRLGGLVKTMPVTAACYLLCAFSVMGVPPFGGFFSKYMVLNGAAAAGHPWLTAVFVLGALLTFVYLIRVFILVFLGEPKMPQAREGCASMVCSTALLAALSLGSGLFIHYPAGLVEAIVRQMAVIVK